MFTKGFLAEVRRGALRKGVWYSALDSVERGILSIASQVIESVKSDLLNFQLVDIISKLRDAYKCGFVKHFELHGMERIKIIKYQAQLFGYNGANNLLKDKGFIK